MSRVDDGPDGRWDFLKLYRDGHVADAGGFGA